MAKTAYQIVRPTKVFGVNTSIAMYQQRIGATVIQPMIPLSFCTLQARRVRCAPLSVENSRKTMNGVGLAPTNLLGNIVARPNTFLVMAINAPIATPTAMATRTTARTTLGSMTPAHQDLSKSLQIMRLINS